MNPSVKLVKKWDGLGRLLRLRPDPRGIHTWGPGLLAALAWSPWPLRAAHPSSCVACVCMAKTVVGP